MTYFKEIERLTIMLLKFQKEYFSMDRYRKGLRPNIVQMIEDTKNGQPYDKIFLAKFYFECWSEISIIKKKRPFEVRRMVRNWSKNIMEELDVKVEIKWQEQ